MFGDQDWEEPSSFVLSSCVRLEELLYCTWEDGGDVEEMNGFHGNSYCHCCPCVILSYIGVCLGDAMTLKLKLTLYNLQQTAAGLIYQHLELNMLPSS